MSLEAKIAHQKTEDGCVAPCVEELYRMEKQALLKRQLSDLRKSTSMLPITEILPPPPLVLQWGKVKIDICDAKQQE